MGRQEQPSPVKRICAGLLAHVDTGKTTLSEHLLYLVGKRKSQGRVDRGEAFLDTDEMERKRGITIFSKQISLDFSDTVITLLDTPGHEDFSAEMERTLQVLDYGVLMVSGPEGIQSHTLTLWRLLAHYGAPVFIFVNKMDQPGADRDRILAQLQKRLDERCVDFSEAHEAFWPSGDGGDEPEGNAFGAFFENLALCSEALMETYLEKGRLEEEEISRRIQKREIFPCYFGSALKGEGTEAFLQGLRRYTRQPEPLKAFAAKVYKITRDEKDTRLTHMKITGGRLKIKDVLTGACRGCLEEEKGGLWQEKAEQIRLYEGAHYDTLKEALPGMVCAVTGLSKTWSGQGLGAEASSESPVLEPALTYEVELSEGTDVYDALLKLRQLEEEAPQLHVLWDASHREIHVQLMGEIETQVLQNMIRQRFGFSVAFGKASILYKETIAQPVEGVGHFEPLRHYAEVHLLLEPGKPGSGLVFESACSEDFLDANWQRLILTHLSEKKHRGVLTGGEITDMKITLLGGRAHQKHTEGGDFRQATYRALRQGLRKAESVLLEPVYQIEMQLPRENAGRAMADIQKRNGRAEPPEGDGEMVRLTARAPVSLMQDYQMEMLSYTKGKGRISFRMGGYAPCHNAAEIIEKAGYDPEGDLENPTGSVFCQRGAGVPVPWDQVEKYMHLPLLYKSPKREEAAPEQRREGQRQKPLSLLVSEKEEEQLEAIFQKTYGPIKRERHPYQRKIRKEAQALEPAYKKSKPSFKSGKTYLLVDGYNIIFAWEDLKELAKTTIDGARIKLLERLSNYQAYKKDTVIVVFDAYKVHGGAGAVERFDGLYVIYTKEAETADQYIEKAVSRYSKEHEVVVATSDRLVQMIIWGEGALRLSARGFLEEVEKTEEEIRRHVSQNSSGLENRPFHKALSQKGEKSVSLEEKERKEKDEADPSV